MVDVSTEARLRAAILAANAAGDVTIKSGRLLFDGDGQGGDVAVQIARLDKKLDLNESHFIVA